MQIQNLYKLFDNFAPPILEQTKIRRKITSSYLKSEKDCLLPLLKEASFDEKLKTKIKNTAKKLIENLRKENRISVIEKLIQEYSLSSQEGVSLMCLAESLLRIPDTTTRDVLIRDKISNGDWKSHLGDSKSLFLNATTWGLIVTGKLTSTVDSKKLSNSLSKLLTRCGEPIVRKGIDVAIRMMGEKFVRGETIEKALEKSKEWINKGFCYSYDMLGEAATTSFEANRYFQDYEKAIHTIGKANQGLGIYEGNGISIKLSALHPRYSRSQADRVLLELMPKVKELAVLAKNYDIGFNIDAEESDRLEISLDILQNLCEDKELKNWQGLGFVVQAYGRRCPQVLDFIINLARKTEHRIMVRLVKGAYWDAEIKKAQVDGLTSFPVFTRKVYSDISYIACAKKLLNSLDAIFPQFATHNAQTLATIYHLAGDDFFVGKYEFQCLHGMGESLYSQVIKNEKLNRPVRIYAPVGNHETLLAYLVRRLLENGANSSFVHQIADKNISVETMITDPVDIIKKLSEIGIQHEKILSPSDLFLLERKNSLGLNLADEIVLEQLSKKFKEISFKTYQAKSTNYLNFEQKKDKTKEILNPSDYRDKVGVVIDATDEDIEESIKNTSLAFKSWTETSPDERAKILEKAADILQEKMPVLLALLVREAGKSVPNAISEVREAIDFLRFYSNQARKLFDKKNNKNKEIKSLGLTVCISPWNFPLAIFLGQISASLIAGNCVLAKPAEETPLIAFEAVQILKEAGIPDNVLHFLPGDGQIGAKLIASSQVNGVLFTGSTQVAKLIQIEISKRLTNQGKPVVLIAETGGQNAMIVDSSALAEQVVADCLVSAFDSSGQRCSALRVLCLQEEIADKTLEMLKGAMQELRIGRTDFLGNDIGAVITKEAQENINSHIEKMKSLGNKVFQLSLNEKNTKYGNFVSPTIIEIKNIKDLEQEVFGPVLHVFRYKRENLDSLIDDLNSSGYGLTFGLHTRIDETINQISSKIQTGNIYINRNIIGAVVGSQPFGGHGLSGTGPKAGGPLYLSRLVSSVIEANFPKIEKNEKSKNSTLLDFADWLTQQGQNKILEFVLDCYKNSNLGVKLNLTGPVGEENQYFLYPKGKILLIAQTFEGLLYQISTCLATENFCVIGNQNNKFSLSILKNLPDSVKEKLIFTEDFESDNRKNENLSGVLIEKPENENNEKDIMNLLMKIAKLKGPIVLTQVTSLDEMKNNCLNLNWLLEEKAISINTTAAGGNASLIALT